MHLWTEYEGRTIAEHYTLGRLLRSEGRNGFFATADKDGHPAVIRLTEAHYDEAEQLERWRHVAEVHQDNLIEIEQVGQTTFEGVALTYALMEPEDANLGDVLKERPMTTAETLQVAIAVLAALKALHSAGLIHEHVEAANVLAVGETVKLRSDCVRECIPDGEFATTEDCDSLRRRDLHDFGTLLLRCLTLETEWAPAHNNLPDPFKRLIPRALDGSWSLEQIGALLEPAAPAFTPARPSPTPTQDVTLPVRSAYATSPLPASPALDVPAASADPAAPAAGKRPLVPPGVRQSTEPENAPLAYGASSPPSSFASDTPIAVRTQRHDLALNDDVPAPPSRGIWLALAAVAVIALALVWHFFFGHNAATTPSRSSAAAPVIHRSVPSTPAPAPAPADERAQPAPEAAATEQTAAGAPGWYVIAFTYNHEGQAAKKAQSLRRNHNSLEPRVFSPTGRAPFLVSLGGAMRSQAQAEAVYRHARRAGLPRDTFVRHY